MITQIKHLERFVLQTDLFGDQDFINHICGSERRIPGKGWVGVQISEAMLVNEMLCCVRVSVGICVCVGVSLAAVRVMRHDSVVAAARFVGVCACKRAPTVPAIPGCILCIEAELCTRQAEPTAIGASYCVSVSCHSGGVVAAARCPCATARMGGLLGCWLTRI